MGARWLVFLLSLCLYVTRVFLVNGWYIVTYGLGIYLLNQFIGFLSPQVGTTTTRPPIHPGLSSRPCSCLPACTGGGGGTCL